MALIKCPECGKEISDRATSCPNCGCPVEEMTHTQEGTVTSNAEQNQSGTPEPPEYTEPGKKLEEAVPAPMQEQGTVSKTKSSGISTQTIAIIMIAAVVVISIIVVILVMRERNKVDFNDFRDRLDSSYCEISDDGTYMTIDTNPDDEEDYFSAEAYADIEYVNEELEFPDSVMKKMDETRALDGRLEEEYNGIKVSWTYHPDDGLEVMYEIVEES